jgi:hypothetical protein
MALFCSLLCCDDVSVRRVAAAALWHLETRLGGIGLKYKKELELLFDLLNMCMKEALGSQMETGEKLDRAAYEGSACVVGIEVDVGLEDAGEPPLGFTNVANPINYKRYIGKIEEQDEEWKPKVKLLEKAVCSRPVRILAVQAATLSELSLSVTCPAQLRQIALPKTLGRVKPFSTTHLPLVS